MPDVLVVRSERHEKCALVRVSGELSERTAPATRLRDEVAGMDLAGPPRIVLDLEQVTACDATGVGAVISLLKRVMQADGRLLITATPGDLLERFERHGLLNRFELRATAQEAVSEFHASP